MTVYESDIPGVGRKFQLELDDGSMAIIVVHHDGRRELFHRPSPDADSTKLFTLSDQQARQFGSIIEGAYFQPVEVESLEVPVGESIIEWIDVPSDSPLIGQTLRELDIRQRTGASIVAIQRDDDTVANPGPDVEVEAGDVIVALADRDELSELNNLVSANN